MTGETLPHRKGAAKGDKAAIEAALRIITEQWFALKIHDDLISEAGSQLWIALRDGRYDGERSLKRFAEGFLNVQRLRDRRKAAREASLRSPAGESLLPGVAAPVTDPSARFGEEGLRAAAQQLGQGILDLVEEVIADKLPAEEQQVIRLYYLDRHHRRDIAARLGKDIQWVKMVLSNAKERVILPALRERILPTLTRTLTRYFAGATAGKLQR